MSGWLMVAMFGKQKGSNFRAAQKVCLRACKSTKAPLWT